LRNALLVLFVTSGAMIYSAFAQAPACKEGNFSSESKPTQERLTAFLIELQKDVAGDDRAAVAGLASYPVTVSTVARRLKIADRAEFVARYSEIFPAELQKFLAAQDSTCISRIGAQGFTVGQGQLWFDFNPDGIVELFTINPVIYEQITTVKH
jgi:hypothetical protein